ncbi:hypothetical protein AWJ20_1701 [Sugiyamaella lignohabitans]|uniref:Uncharacterized protein n=1 Tax=Sugiyamaella lignohabitans TaxID=796027 RepID=A0A167DXF1_9ASCO|nr:uncharacterized protein AWJ20_1701 [Sugiyamaella lignohabitans]ANB13410.1 hypothetical protein AWJ20_1701 [Sugiyamaella lignohabitans]
MPEEIELKGIHDLNGLSYGHGNGSMSSSHHEKTIVVSRGYIMTKIILLVVQIALVVGCFITYEKLFRASSYGAAALAAGSMSGLAQGLLQAATSRQIKISTILKFYVWGVLNGLWTVCTHIFC